MLRLPNELLLHVGSCLAPIWYVNLRGTCRRIGLLLERLPISLYTALAYTPPEDIHFAQECGMAPPLCGSELLLLRLIRKCPYWRWGQTMDMERKHIVLLARHVFTTYDDDTAQAFLLQITDYYEINTLDVLISYELVKARNYTFNRAIYGMYGEDLIMEDLMVATAILCLPHSMGAVNPILTGEGVCGHFFMRIYAKRRACCDPAPLRPHLGAKYARFCETLNRCLLARAGTILPGTRLGDMIKWDCLRMRHFTLGYFKAACANIVIDAIPLWLEARKDVCDYLTTIRGVEFDTDDTKIRIMYGEDPDPHDLRHAYVRLVVKYERFDLLAQIRSAARYRNLESYNKRIASALFAGYRVPLELQ